MLNESPMAPPKVPNPYKNLDLANTIRNMLSLPKSKLEDPELRFNITPEAAESNFELLQKNDFDLKKLYNKELRSTTSFGSEFKQTSVLEKLFKHHPRWN